MEKKKTIFAVGTSTLVTIRNNNGNASSSTQSTEKFSFTKVNFFHLEAKSIFVVCFRQSRTHLFVVTMILLLLLHQIRKFWSVLSMINMKKNLLHHHRPNRRLLHWSIIVIHRQSSNVYMMHPFKQHLHHPHHHDRRFVWVHIDDKVVPVQMNTISPMNEQLAMISMNHQLNVRCHLLEKRQQQRRENNKYCLQVLSSEQPQVHSLVRE